MNLSPLHWDSMGHCVILKTQNYEFRSVFNWVCFPWQSVIRTPLKPSYWLAWHNRPVKSYFVHFTVAVIMQTMVGHSLRHLRNSKNMFACISLRRIRSARLWQPREIHRKITRHDRIHVYSWMQLFLSAICIDHTNEYVNTALLGWIRRLARQPPFAEYGAQCYIRFDVKCDPEISEKQ